MGRLLLIYRLAVRDLRRRPTQAGLLVLVITATTATLTLGLALRGVTDNPWQRVRTATAGPDLVATTLDPGAIAAGSGVNGGPRMRTGTEADLRALSQAPGVVGFSGPYPLAVLDLAVGGTHLQVNAEGRDPAPVTVEQPDTTSGGWVRNGGAVIEQGLADALRVRAGDAITLAGRPLRIAGIALTTARAPYPLETPGEIWVTRTDLRQLTSPTQTLSYTVNLRLADPAAAPSFAAAHFTPGAWVRPWQNVRDRDAKLITDVQGALLAGSSLLALLAMASIAVLVGGRMVEQTRRVGLLKAVGATPGQVAVVLLAEHLTLAVAAAVLGLVTGRLAAPLLTAPGSGLLGAPGTPSLTPTAVALVLATATAVAALATLVPAVRAARTSTLRALHDPAHPPRRQGRLIAATAGLPIPLLLGLRLAARRPRRTVLAASSLVVTTAMLVAQLSLRHDLDVRAAQRTGGQYLPGLASPVAQHVSQVLLVLTVVLLILAAVNTIFICWTTVLDAQRPCALARAMGATPRQITAGLSTTQLIPALIAAVAGIPAGLGLYRLAAPSDAPAAIPPLWWLLAVVAATLTVTAALTALPARIGARRPVAGVLRSE
jgi:putative ABC transport system permease protein